MGLVIGKEMVLKYARKTPISTQLEHATPVVVTCFVLRVSELILDNLFEARVTSAWPKIFRVKIYSRTTLQARTQTVGISYMDTIQFFRLAVLTYAKRTH